MTSHGVRMRLDQALVARGLAPSRSQARQLIESGFVSVAGSKIRKVAFIVSETDSITLSEATARHVSRAAAKLVAGLNAFSVEPAGKTCLDIGASTGGFTQVLLENAAAHVVAIDVGHGQMHDSIASLQKVTLIENLNARNLSQADLAGHAINLIVCDVSFISLKQALPPALKLAQPGAQLVALIKPQFEAGRRNIGKGGVVRDEAVRSAVCNEISHWLADEMGWQVQGIVPSPVTGSDGNLEYLVAARKP